MPRSVQQDRSAQLLLLSDPDLNYAAARARLERAAIVISCGNAGATSWGQAALLTFAQCAVRMFRGGVFLGCKMDQEVIIGNRKGIPLYRVLMDLGCRSEIAPDHAICAHVGIDPGGINCSLRCWADGWSGVTSPRDAVDVVTEGNELGGVIAGAMAVSELFRSQVLGDVRAGKRMQSVSALYPQQEAKVEPPHITMDYLPSSLWLLGLGNLGQASLWILSLLPYSDPSKVNLLLQDTDVSGPENLDIQILTTHAWVGLKKVRAAAMFAENRGFKTVISERQFTETTYRTEFEPGLLLCGVDNLEARRAAARLGAGFELVIDAGLGGSATEIFDIRIHSFPGARTPTEAWPTPQAPREQQLPISLQSLIEEGRLDICGALTIAGTSMGVPSTAVVAAAIQIGQACRAIATSEYCDLVDLSLRDPHRSFGHDATLARGRSINFQKSARVRNYVPS